MAGLKTIIPPTVEPLEPVDLIRYLRLDADTDEDEMLAYIRQAREYVENYTARAFVNRTLRLSLDGFNEVDTALWEGHRVGPDLTLKKRSFALPKPPLVSVTSIITYNDQDAGVVFPAGSYYVDNSREPGHIVLRTGATWPTALRVANAIEVLYVAGYGPTAATVPESIKFAMKSIAAWMYEHRGEEDFNKLPANISMLLQAYRVMSFGTDPFSNGHRA